MSKKRTYRPKAGQVYRITWPDGHYRDQVLLRRHPEKGSILSTGWDCLVVARDGKPTNTGAWLDDKLLRKGLGNRGVYLLRRGDASSAVEYNATAWLLP